ncbi:hypothetical protein BO94DRAFT_590981 [Aspergillus sclerotioniger CBS 115572]|uniref:ferric-chelate reductase (NADPH) n=1 Tax=Aspergillus sclerotioniger CBS 115572 TaxID=1450535 RepID=A0A317UYE1_9EURO|nr:hypothetical protein BO94DRAFT_590981 [Aspergillus sclerotioniger CBS 115572]PWY67073.1 hypothetical protein BO94DRAFT_590981 [Aspergillus sclerotioniger CBS 115572]
MPATVPMGNSTAAKALRLSNNEWSNKYFAISIGVIMVLFTFHHWSSVIYFHYGPRKSNTTLNRCYRKTRRFLSGAQMGQRTDRCLLYGIYWAINLSLCLTNVNLNKITYVAKRLGWISVANLVLLVFLALKNTPLAPLTAKSYEKLRPLHKVAGYTCIFTSCLHGIVYLAAWSELGDLVSMQETRNLAGAIAGIAMVIIGLSTISYIMRGSYEIFYMLHVTMFLLIMITVGMHRPKLSTSTLIIVIFTACLWFVDRIIRGAKVVWYFFGNYATVTALPNNALRVRLSRCMNSRPGSHAFLWVPAIRWVESHPFTMLSSSPTEFLIRVYDGFTRDLYQAAQKAPGRSLRCSVDGPYGQVHNFEVYDKAILIAGGSGASFTFAVSMDLIASSSRAVHSIDFIWVVRHQDSLEWFEQELKELQDHPDVNVIIHVTSQVDPSAILSSTPSDLVSEKASVKGDITPPQPSPTSMDFDPEKGPFHQPIAKALTSPNEIRQGRPDIDKLIATAVNTSGNTNDRIIVGACGPRELTAATRKAVTDILRNDGPAITIYTEEFEW